MSITNLTIKLIDIFDTLLAKTVPDQIDLFDLIEKKNLLPNFTNLRRNAYRRSNGTWDDIYHQLQELSPETPDITIQQLKDLEWQITRENYTPIIANWSQINKGDVLVAHTYLTAFQIKELLTLHHFSHEQIPLILFNTKRIILNDYDTLIQQYHINTYMGTKEPIITYLKGKHQITIHPIYARRFSTLELKLWMIHDSIHPLIKMLRKVRLSNPYPVETIEHELYKEQVAYNLPILCFIASDLVHRMKKENRTELLLTTRDGCILMKIMSHLYPEINCQSFESSRLMYQKSNSTYVDYVKKMYNHHNSLIFDLNGSFQTGRNFFQQFIGLLPRVHLFSYSKQAPIYFGLTYNLDHPILLLENYNIDQVGSLIDFDVHGPIRAPVEISKPLIRVIHQASNNFVEQTNASLIVELISQIKSEFWLDFIKTISPGKINNTGFHLPLSQWLTEPELSFCTTYQRLIDRYTNQLQIDELNLLEISSNNYQTLNVWFQYFHGVNIHLTWLNLTQSQSNQSHLVPKKTKIIQQLDSNCKYHIIIDHRQSYDPKIWSVISDNGCYLWISKEEKLPNICLKESQNNLNQIDFNLANMETIVKTPWTLNLLFKK